MIKPTDPAKRAILDIETSPMDLRGFGLRNQFFSIDQIEKPTQMLSIAAKWYGSPRTLFSSAYVDDAPGIDPEAQRTMVQAAWDLVNEAEIVIHYNGKSFDMRHLNREFIEQGFGPPSPYQYIDLYKMVKKHVYLPSYKLDYVLLWLGFDRKVAHTGFEMWNQVLDGDVRARRLFKRYNIGDVTKTELVYDRLMGWIDDHPNLQLLVPGDPDGAVRCPTCLSTNNKMEGTAPVGKLSRVQRYSCKNCGRWFRGKETVIRAEER